MEPNSPPQAAPRLHPLRRFARCALAPVTRKVERARPARGNQRLHSCFCAGTRVRRADGSEQPIEQLRVGDRVVGRHGSVNRVRAVERVPLAGRRLYRINGGRAFVTGEHPFLSATGWRSIEPSTATAEHAELQVGPLHVGDQLLLFNGYRGQFGGAGDAAAHQMQLVPDFSTRTITSLEAVAAAADQWVYNLLLDGNHTYIADDYLVHNCGR